MKKTKPFPVTKAQVWAAWKRVKGNQGGAGIDRQSLADFEKDLGNNLYKVWNRMASGSYHPQSVRRVNIPKASGGVRPLGIPTVADRIAQMVVVMVLEPELEPVFHEDSYGYRPNKSAHDALRQTRKRCWACDWVLDLDIKSFFDEIDHGLLMKAVRKHTHEKWVLLYIERWLTASVVHPDGTEEARDRGTPQGGVISPLLANLFLHYAFDLWMVRNHPTIPFERYADDVVCHCLTQRQAHDLWHALEARFAACRLRLHPDKTRIVYCKDGRRRGHFPHTSFDFLGYTFRPRGAKSSAGRIFTGFNPAISNKAEKRIRAEIRSWRLQLRSTRRLSDLAEICNRRVQGWINYYGAFNRSALRRLMEYLDYRLVKWAMRKYKRFRGRWLRAYRWLQQWAYRDSSLFVHWQFLYGPPLLAQQRLHWTSRMR